MQLGEDWKLLDALFVTRDATIGEFEAIAATLEPGAAIFAVLHAGASTTVLEDAVTRCGGRRIADEPADNAGTLAEGGQFAELRGRSLTRAAAG